MIYPLILVPGGNTGSITGIPSFERVGAPPPAIYTVFFSYSIVFHGIFSIFPIGISLKYRPKIIYLYSIFLLFPCFSKIFINSRVKSLFFLRFSPFFQFSCLYWFPAGTLVQLPVSPLSRECWHCQHLFIQYSLVTLLFFMGFSLFFQLEFRSNIAQKLYIYTVFSCYFPVFPRFC